MRQKPPRANTRYIQINRARTPAAMSICYCTTCSGRPLEQMQSDSPPCVTPLFPLGRGILAIREQLTLEVSEGRNATKERGTMAVESQTMENATKEGTPLERYVNSHVGNFIHMFLSVLAVLVMAAACIALFQIVHYGFPQLWHAPNEYQTLHQLLQSILLLAIAGELALLLLFHRA